MDPVTVVRVLLASPHFDPSGDARTHLHGGSVDPRLVLVLAAVAAEHRIRVPLVTPRAADIVAVDGVPVAEQPTHPRVLAVGHLLRGLPPRRRPDRIRGPGPWHESLDYPAGDGFHAGASPPADRLQLAFTR
jgi:hypothetical protein